MLDDCRNPRQGSISAVLPEFPPLTNEVRNYMMVEIKIRP